MDASIRGFENFSIHNNGNFLLVGNQILWFNLPTKTTKISTPRAIVLSQYVVLKSEDGRLIQNVPNYNLFFRLLYTIDIILVTNHFALHPDKLYYFLQINVYNKGQRFS